MRREFNKRLIVLAALAAALPLTAAAQTASIGQAAPAFEVKDASGKLVKLADFKGKHVVLEWTNPGCPFVVKHYGAQNMQALQKDAAAKNVVWLSVSSTAPGQTDYLAPAALTAKYKTWGAAPAAMLMDDSGSIGKAYGAKTTPHMYVIDPGGKLVYAGGIDDKRSADPGDIPGAKNFVKAALAESLAGKPVSTTTAAPYGCSVKYAS
ncbi:thioredoxin family protein [uncultured Methylibium sp.]|uniref:thioredoxin family protein n=1 Tax=uncultured Methylibium sp. TaxID=381093 RepID=UPI0025D5F272|nr:thioredoxin family protein [uncultured Methylibium sp.]